MKHHLHVARREDGRTKVSFRDSHVLCTGEIIENGDGTLTVHPTEKPAKVLAWGKWNMTVQKGEIRIVATCNNLRITATGSSRLVVKNTPSPDQKLFTAKSDGMLEYHFGGCGCSENRVNVFSEEGKASMSFPDHETITGRSLAYTGHGGQIYVNSARVVTLP
jgi:hypothetical protein